MKNPDNGLPLSTEDREALCKAVRLLQNPGFFIRMVNLVGAPIDALIEKLPSGAAEKIRMAVSLSLEKALNISLYGLESGWGLFQNENVMKGIVIGTGAVGGAFGFAALGVELPLSTCVMLRSIAEIARAEGEDLRSPSGQLACLEVFALGGKKPTTEFAESAYYAVRAGLSHEVRAALQYLARSPADKAGAPVIVRLIEVIAERFGVQVSEKAAAQAVPAIGALGGAAINAFFMDHFQDMAHGHFTVRRLERKYGEEIIQHEYSRCMEDLP